ncbi:hypothetical protein [Nocardia sp. CA-290969]|uniref:hypothetical protein n=1 Tax=Nocardia sp. CA-290969 TaxID=3239986 RepID=UPI003D9263D5
MRTRRQLPAQPRAGRVFGLLLVGVLLAVPGCVDRPEPTMPTWPAGVEQPPEYSFGDAVAGRSQRAWGPVFDALAQRFGRERLEVGDYTLTAETGPDALRRELDAELVGQRGWRTMAPQTVPSDAWAFGYERPDGRHIVALIGLDARPGDTRVPLTVVTTFPQR